MIIPILIAMGLGGAFLGSQFDDIVDNATRPPAGGTTEQKIPYYITIPLVIAGGTAALLITKKLIKKI